MKNKADLYYALRLRNPKLTVSDVQILHKSIYTPAMKYSLPAINEECFAPVQSKVLASILNGIGMACTIPTAICHGSESMGGLDLLDLRTKYGISTIKHGSGNGTRVDCKSIPAFVT